MTSIDGIRRIVKPLMDKIKIIITLGEVSSVDDSKNTQEVEVEGLADERQNVQNFQPFGLTGNPPAGSRGLFMSVGGNRSHGILINAEDGNIRIKNLEPGEVAIYNGNDKKIVLKNNRIEITGDVQIDGDLAVMGELTATGNIQTNGSFIDSNGNLSTFARTHIHSTPTGPSGTPMPPPPTP